jgi:hypothetical protein
MNFFCFDSCLCCSYSSLKSRKFSCLVSLGLQPAALFPVKIPLRAEAVLGFPLVIFAMALVSCLRPGRIQPARSSQCTWLHGKFFWFPATVLSANFRCCILASCPTAGLDPRAVGAVGF